MSSVKFNIDGTTSTSFQVGKKGGQLKYLNDEFFVRDDTDNFYVKVHGGDPTEDTHFTTKRYVDAQTGNSTDAGSFYGISIAETDGNPSYTGINKLNFDSNSFYIERTSISSDEVTIAFRNPDKYRHTIIAGVADVGKNATVSASYGHNASTADPVMAYAGSVVAISISLTDPRTDGTCTLQVKLNGVAQTGTGQTTQLNATNTQTNYQILTTPITYVAGDTIGLQTVTAGTFKPDKADATVIAYCEETV